MMATWLDVDFGAGKTGLANVGYRLYKSDGTDAAARTEAGVVEIGGGAYGAPVTIAADTAGIEWDTGEGTPIYAHEDFTKVDDLHKAHFNRRKWDKVADTVTLYADDGVTPLYVFDTDDDMSELTPQ